MLYGVLDIVVVLIFVLTLRVLEIPVPTSCCLNGFRELGPETRCSIVYKYLTTPDAVSVSLNIRKSRNSQKMFL
jgi:hypothetical protein